MDEKPSLSIVIPCYNEAQRIAGALSGAIQAMECYGGTAEVIVVDDGSSDETFRLASELCSSDDRITVIHRPHRGKGGALMEGVALCRGDLIFTADADWSMPPEQILRFIDAFNTDENLHLAISSREIDGAVRHSEPIRRHIIGRLFNLFVRIVALSGVQDSQCGFKAYRAPAAHELFSTLQTLGWAFDVEILLRAKKAGLSMLEIPIDWTYDADSRLNTFTDAVTMTYAVIKLRLVMLFSR